jgi:two-component system chemotaxis sensor kinase CheA
MTSFGDAFLEDYFAECDEHLTSIRQALLALDKSVGAASPDAAVIEQLFRGYHSLKGLAGMVEDRRGELLAHEMESYLRAVRDGDAALTTLGVERLIDGTRALEDTVVALHARAEPPDTSAVVQHLRQLFEVGAPAEGRKAAADTPTPAVASECVFTPSAELTARGITVDTVRTRLRERGTIISAAPQVTAGGGVAFRFLLTSRLDTATVDAWREDGLVCVNVSAGLAAPAVLSQVEPPAPASGLSSGHFVRVDLGRLDDLMRMIGDMVILRARLTDALDRVEPFVPANEWRAIQENSGGIERQLRELRDGVMRVRLVPVGEIFRRMPFVVRDLARETERRVHVALEGQETQIDKFLVERMMDPILHLVRNAVSHGLEPADERRASGKPVDGTVTLRAWASGETVTLEVSDDGRGIDAERVLQRAARARLPVPSGIVDADGLLDLICSPGFSTKDQSDRASGRGFGMAVVRKTVQDLGGSLRLASTPGEGTTFTIELPLTLAITDALLASVSARTFAVPQNAVREVIEIEDSQIRAIEGGEVTAFRGEALPLVRLADALGISPVRRDRYHAFIVRHASGDVGVVVDRVMSQREVVVRTTTDPLIRVPGIAGATDLGDGRAVLILDIAAIARAARGPQRSPQREIA